MEESFQKLAINSENEKTGWSNLPIEMKIEVLYYLETSEKIKFSKNSPKCLEEVRKTKGFVKEIKIFWGERDSRIDIKYWDDYLMSVGFEMLSDDSTRIFYRDATNIYHENPLVERRMADLALRCFRSFMSRSENIEDFELDMIDSFPIDRFCINNWKMLKSFKIRSDSDSRNFSLDRLFEVGFISQEKLLSIEKLNFDNILIREEKLLQIKSKEMRLTNMDAELLRKFMNAWKEIRRIRKYTEIDRKFEKLEFVIREEDEEIRENVWNIVFNEAQIIGNHKRFSNICAIIEIDQYNIANIRMAHNLLTIQKAPSYRTAHRDSTNTT
ncbi:unnamed protein product [Caenorhabditis angaria]|uniref:F-box domain-containing protein n=1 Tax=Caenorhabditis angaria TaxID=860376 RepID=A0A9P1I8V9_9PELO|nr:unnamed protein product [Caenorhabditis angaria]